MKRQWTRDLSIARFEATSNHFFLSLPLTLPGRLINSDLRGDFVAAHYMGNTLWRLIDAAYWGNMHGSSRLNCAYVGVTSYHLPGR